MLYYTRSSCSQFICYKNSPKNLAARLHFRARMAGFMYSDIGIVHKLHTSSDLATKMYLQIYSTTLHNQVLPYLGLQLLQVRFFSSSSGAAFPSSSNLHPECFFFNSSSSSVEFSCCTSTESQSPLKRSVAAAWCFSCGAEEAGCQLDTKMSIRVWENNCDDCYT